LFYFVLLYLYIVLFCRVCTSSTIYNSDDNNNNWSNFVQVVFQWVLVGAELQFA